ncbi:MAG: SufD family Fe-S cluster assembly protein, partial [Henriciella sp.]|uniref:SufD family Fe-S cluster assembly protein n=1 Tax=Henriciella sp. TaxID=1968823 RepID=UPI003C78A558
LRVFVKSEAQALGGAETMPLAALTASLTGKPGANDLLQFEVTGKIEAPLFIDYGGAGEAVFSRLAFIVRPNSAIDIIESHSASSGFSSAMLEFGIQAGGSVSRTILQDNGSESAAAITGSVTLSERASYNQTVLAFGAKLARVETRVCYDGPGAKAVLNSAYLPKAGRHIDLTSLVRHGAESCVTRQLTKGAISKGGKGIFQGKFHVPRTVGQYTDADMQHQALLLDDGAEVFAKPELEIYADDVECAHGNTSGQLDEAALFYMRQRGLPLNEARALLTEAFVNQALETAHPAVRDDLVGMTRDFLHAQA